MPKTLSQSQTHRAVENPYEGSVSRSQIASLLKYYHTNISLSVSSLDDLRFWCSQYSAFNYDKMFLHEPLIEKFYINSKEDSFIFITTKKLISTAPMSIVFQVDAIHVN